MRMTVCSHTIRFSSNTMILSKQSQIEPAMKSEIANSLANVCNSVGVNATQFQGMSTYIPWPRMSTYQLDQGNTT
jgi:hypothetical protein